MKMAYPHMIYDQRHSSSVLLISLLLCYNGGKCLLVKTSVGDDAVLPCEVDLTTDATDLSVYWSRLDLPPDQYVHFQRDRHDLVDHKYSSYKGRTSLFVDELKKGNVSLKLSRVKSSDEGNYTCFIPAFPEEVTIQLIVVSNYPRHGSRRKSTENLSCFRTTGTDPNSVNVTFIYNGLVDTGFLWEGEPSDILLCSGTSAPASSRCVPCILDQTVHVICKNISETVQLMMEAVDEIIDNIKTDCPTFYEYNVIDPKEHQDQHDEETQFSTIGFFIAIVTLIFSSITAVLVFKRRHVKEFIKRFFKCAFPADRSAVCDHSEVAPMKAL